MSCDCASTMTRKKNRGSRGYLFPHTPSFNFLQAKWEVVLYIDECRTTKGSLPPSVCLPLRLMIGQPVRQLPDLPRVKTVGSMIHFAMKGKKNKKTKKESACERRNSPDHWEIIRWSGMVDVELNGIINQAKKQARCSYIYYLHVFHFRRCNKQIYVGLLTCVRPGSHL